MVRDELDIRTRDARVDMDAARINRRMMIIIDSGMILLSSSGIRASKLGEPSVKNAEGVASGERKMRVVDPTK